MLAGLRAGEPAGFADLVRSYAGRLHHLARRYVGAEQAHDVVQETFTKAFASLHQFRGHSAVYTWLHQIAVNTCLSQIRKSATRRE